MKWLSLCLVSILLLTGCKTYDTLNVEHTKIYVGPGPEDFVFDMTFGQPRLIVSCAERNKKAQAYSEFWQIDLNTDQAKRLPHKQLPDDINLNAHGVDFGITRYGKTLFVVNHDQGKEKGRRWNVQSILLFKIYSDSLVYKDIITNDTLMTSPNDVCFDGENGIYISNDSRKLNRRLEQLMFKTSYVLHYNLSTKKWSKVVDDVGFANGVLTKNDTLYVSGVREKSVKGYVNENNEWRLASVAAGIKGADNLMLFDHDIYVATHPDLVKFASHAFNQRKNSPGQIFKIDSKLLQTTTNSDETGMEKSDPPIGRYTVEPIYEDDGAMMSAPSTAFQFNESIYVAQVFRPYILKLPAKD